MTANRMADDGRASTSRVADLHSFSKCDLSDLWTKNGKVYRTIGFITDPAVIIQDVVSGESETHVISSRNFSEYAQHPKRRPPHA